jgi:hypothetical protein
MQATDKLSLAHRARSGSIAARRGDFAAVRHAQPVLAQSTRSLLAALRWEDMRWRKSPIGSRPANAPLCDRLEPALGMQLHSIDQYPPDVRADARSGVRLRGAGRRRGRDRGGPAERARAARE